MFCDGDQETMKALRFKSNGCVLFYLSKRCITCIYHKIIAINVNFIVYGFTRSGLKPTIHRTWGEYASHCIYLLPCVWDSLWSLTFCVRFSVIASLVHEILCDHLPCAWYSLWSLASDHRESHAQGKQSYSISRTRQTITENLTHKASYHRKSHTEGKRSQRITHTREEITENNTHKARYSVITCLVRDILSDRLPCAWDSLWSLAVCVRFSPIACLVCEILCDRARDNRE
jgi:hypothetical protein